MQTRAQWDAIVIGSGMGGLSAAAALARTGYRVLVLEQHFLAGGLTQTFAREGFRWDVGVHYLGEVGPGGAVRGLVDWLSDGALDFAPLGDVYDVAHFPDGFEIPFPRGETELLHALKQHFEAAGDDIDAVFSAFAAAEEAGRALYTERALPGVLSRLHGLWHGSEIRKWWGRSSAEVMAELVHDPKLAAVFLTQSLNYGGVPADEISFGLQAMVTRHYFDGAFYPVGGAGAFARALVPVIERAGGEVRVSAKVCALIVEDGAVKGVRLATGEEFRAATVLSAIGARNSVRLLPAEMQAGDWAQELLSFAPAVCHVALYLGLEGDVAARGATRANHWFHADWQIGARPWDPSAGGAPSTLFVSFPSLKDPGHDAGPERRHTAEIATAVEWAPFARWQDSTHATRPAAYSAFKADIEARLLAEFARHFPDLSPLVVAHEVSTPLTNAAFIGSDHGAIYGIEVSPRRFLAPGLRPRTPVPGLILAGQDVVSPGVTGAMYGGVLAASQVEMRILSHM